jgi:enoyl-[acyl-carrier protein] reductase II
MSSNRICDLFGIKYPIIQAGMVWCSGWRLASAVSNSGGLGIIGSGSMHPEILEEHIRKAKIATDKPFGVNVPLLNPEIEGIMKVIIDEKVKIVFTSAGSPKKWTSFLKDHGIIVTHVVSSAAFAVKSEEAGVNAIVAEGFEAGGHDGREETTTITLIPSVRRATTLPLMAAGGIATGRAMLSAMILGADGVQIGSRFAVSNESSAHENFKKRVVDTGEGETYLTLKKLTPVRMIKNKFFEQVQEAENRCASIEELKILLGRGRSKRGMFEGELDEGELEIGQVSSLIDSILPASAIMKNILNEYNSALSDLQSKSAFQFETNYIKTNCTNLDEFHELNDKL